jgi:hypothetical protein
VAYTALTVVTSSKDGATLSAPAAVDGTNGNAFVNTGREMIEITNGGGAPINVTFVTTLTYSGFAIADNVVAITNGSTKVIGPFDTALYNGSDPAENSIGFTFSSATSVTARVIKLGST